MKLKAYTGDEPYVFVSYSHTDGDDVYRDIERLQAKGCRIWFDEGIAPSQEWPEEIARAIDGCCYFLVFLSPKAVNSKYVKREIAYAVDQDKQYLPVYLADTTLPPGLKWQLGTVQALFRHRLGDSDYFSKLWESIPTEAVDGDKLISGPKSAKPVERANPVLGLDQNAVSRHSWQPSMDT